MKEIPLNSVQLMMSSDELSYDLGLIPTPKQMEQNKIMSYILIGAFANIAIGIVVYNFYNIHQENKLKKARLGIN